MRNIIIALAILVVANVASAATAVTISSITFFNFVPSGTAFLGTAPPIYGPFLGTNGGTSAWQFVPLNGIQSVGLLDSSSGTANLCYNGNNSMVVLNAALYKGDAISITYGQPQIIPAGISCACYGSACSTA